MPRDRDVMNAAQAALEAIGSFDGVFLWGFRDAGEQGAEHTRAVAILPVDGAEDDRWDDVTHGLALVTGHLRLVVMARDENPQARDEAAGLMLDQCFNALNGAGINAQLIAAGLAPSTYPQWCKCKRWTWKEPTPPQREIEVVFEYVYDAPTVTGFDTTA